MCNIYIFTAHLPSMKDIASHIPGKTLKGVYWVELVQWDKWHVGPLEERCCVMNWLNYLEIVRLWRRNISPGGCHVKIMNIYINPCFLQGSGKCSAVAFPKSQDSRCILLTAGGDLQERCWVIWDQRNVGRFFNLPLFSFILYMQTLSVVRKSLLYIIGRYQFM